jgi:hypothetical protein
MIIISALKKNCSAIKPTIILVNLGYRLQRKLIIWFLINRNYIVIKFTSGPCWLEIRSLFWFCSKYIRQFYFIYTSIKVTFKFSIAKEVNPWGYLLFSPPSIIKCQEKIFYSFLWALWFPSTNKTHRHDITEILLKVTVNTITTNPATPSYKLFLTVVLTYQRQLCISVYHIICVFAGVAININILNTSIFSI